MSDQNQQATLLGKIAAYTEILVKDSKSTIFVSLAETYRKMGMFEDSRQIIVRGLELHPDFSPAHIVLARVLCQLEDFEASEIAFQRALGIDPESLAALVGYARVKILLGQEDEARDLLLRARHLSPADPVINKLLLSLPNTDIAKDEVEVDEEPEAPPAAPLISQTLGDLYLKQGLKEDALKVYQELLSQNPDDLALRRKIKELESDFSSAEAIDGEADSVETRSTSFGSSEPSDEEIADFDEGFSTVQSEDDSSLTASVPENADQKVLDTLNQWLLNIEQGRGHV